MMMALLLALAAPAAPESVTVYGWIECDRARTLHAWSSPVPFSRLCKTVEAAFGKRRGSYLYGNELVGKQVLLAQGAPDNNHHPLRLRDGNFLLFGCRHKSCEEKSALIATPDGELLAAGLISFQCGTAGRTCADHPILTIFVEPENDRPIRIQQIKAWAKHVSVGGYEPVGRVEKVILR